MKYETLFINDEQVDVTMSDEKAATALQHARSDFARSLSTQFFAQQRPLSNKQRAWMHKLANEVTGTPLFKLPKITAMINRAFDLGIKRPIIRGIDCKIGRRADGSMYVYDLVNSRTVGTIFSSGCVRQKMDMHITAELLCIESDPIEFALMYGHRTGACCFCGRHLETTESVTAGYGPVCADKYGLPWSAKDGGVSLRGIITEAANNA